MGDKDIDMNKEKFTFVSEEEKLREDTRPSLTYWADAWRRLKKNRLAMVGLAGVILVMLFGVVGPYFFEASYSDQRNDLRNLPPRLELYEIGDDVFAYVTRDYNFLIVEEETGEMFNVERVNQEEVMSGRIDVDEVLSPSQIREQRDAVEKTNVNFYQLDDEIIELLC